MVSDFLTRSAPKNWMLQPAVPPIRRQNNQAETEEEEEEEEEGEGTQSHGD